MNTIRTRTTGLPQLAAGVLGAVMLTIGSTLAVEDLPDWQVSNAVDDQITEDPAVTARAIDVATEEGIVTLTGSVNNILAKDRAEKIAATVKGVRGIVNQINVHAPHRSDADIETDVLDALQWDPATDSWTIAASVTDGTVRLSGTVDSWQERELIATVAKGVRGVTGIDNTITVDYQTDRTNIEIQEEVAAALRWDTYVDGALVNVSVDNGDVTLTGTVGSVAEKHRAYTDAWVAGVRSVDSSGLQVEVWARDARLRKDKYVPMSDAEVENAVKDTFLYDPRVTSFEISVDSTDGTVTLRGTVDNLRAKRAAAQDARSAVGVWRVNNRIKVRPDARSDNRIVANVEDALARDPLVERYEIVVSVVDGEVYLSGDVDSTFEKTQAENVAARQIGVEDVNNMLSVNDPNFTAYNPYTDAWYLYDYDWYVTTDRTTTKSDWEIEADIEDEFFWSPFVDSNEVNVDVDGAVAHLTGTVDTWADRQAATENAIEGGAVIVDNDLIVAYGPVR